MFIPCMSPLHEPNRTEPNRTEPNRTRAQHNTTQHGSRLLTPCPVLALVLQLRSRHRPHSTKAATRSTERRPIMRLTLYRLSQRALLNLPATPQVDSSEEPIPLQLQASLSGRCPFSVMLNPAAAQSLRPAASTSPVTPAPAPVIAPGHSSGQAIALSHMDPVVAPADGFRAVPSDDIEDPAPLVVLSSPSSVLVPPPPPSSALPVPPAAIAPLVDLTGASDSDQSDATAALPSPPDSSGDEDDAMPPPPPADVEPDVDEVMPSAGVGAGAAEDPRPTMAMLLSQQEAIRRDNAEVDAARRRVETPKPLAIDIEAIERQYAAGGDWSAIASSIHQSRPYQLPRAKYDMVIETGKTFAKTPLTKIMAALVGTNYGNRALDRLYEQKLVGQVSKLPGGNLRLKLKSREACLKLERTTVSILGGVFPFKPFDVLASKFYLDVSNVDSDTNTDLMLRRLYLLGCEPVYDTFRDVNLATGLTSATWRVYFRSSECPPPLVVNGSVCDQIVFNNKLYPAHGKDAPFQSERLPFGFRSHHGIDLKSSESSNAAFARSASASVATPAAKSNSSKNQEKALPAPPKTYAQAAQAGPVFSSLRNALEDEEKKEDGQLQSGAQHGQRSAASQLAKRIIDIDDALSISTFTGSGGRISPPASPKAPPKPVLLLTNGSDGFTTVENKKKRSRGGVDFSNMLTKQMPKPLDGVATANYFQVLQTMEVRFESIDATVDKKYGVRHHVRPVDVKRPGALKASTESAFFVEKHHTKIRKASKPSPVVEVTESMISDENTALLNTLADRLEDADKKVDGIATILGKATNPDHILKKAVESPLAFNSALSLKMAASGNEIEELVQLHMINRVLSATKPDEDTTFAEKWKKLMGASVPSKRQDIFVTCGAERVRALAHVDRADAVRERSLDPVRDGTSGRMDSRSPRASAAPEHAAESPAWQGHMLDELEELRTLEGHYPADDVLTVNTNGVKKNGHLLIENLLSKYAISCVQETKFADRSHLASFKFHLESAFKHKLFVSDSNSLLDRPTRGRSNGVLTVLRSDFPGFDTVVEMTRMTVPGRYLVVRVTVELAPVYIHNVYAPVDKQEKQAFFSSLPTEEFEDGATHLVLGDLNTPLDPSLDCSTPDLRYDPSRSCCLEWLARLGVVDAWRIHHDSARVFTGPMPRKNRLDYILVSDAFCNSFYGDAKYFLPRHAGDHLAHSVSFKPGSQLHGRGYWKFPRYLLDYPLVVSAIQREAEDVLAQLRSASNPGKTWEQWKSSIKAQLQDLQKKLRAQDTQAVEDARVALDQAAARYRVSADDANRELYEEAMRDYKETVTRSSQYHQDTAFDFQAANSEKSTKHFFRPLDTTLRRVSIEGVATPSGSVSTSPHEICLRFLEHWGSEMGDPNSPTGRAPPSDNAVQRKLLDSVVRVLSELDREALDMDVTALDLTEAIKHMKATSSPGMDGLTAGFYQVAPDVFGQCLELVFNDRLERGKLLASQRKSAVVLLHKKGSRADPGNYRPIALVQVDVKVLSKALTYRLQSAIPKLIHPDQKGFVRGRSIHHHVRFLADLQDLVTSRDEEAYALFLDFQKAFDRVNWDYMFRLLERMGIGDGFTRWVKLLYTDPQAHMLINGDIQPALHPTRGVKQGDPLSALLFILTIEPLGNMLRSHEEYGVCLNDDHTATSIFFADDSALLGSSIVNLQAQLGLVEEYCQGSGAKLNLSKSVLLALNRSHDCPSMPGVQVLGRSESVKYLGIPFSQSTVDDRILESLDQRFYDGFKSWYRRARTLRGRLLVAQTMVLSRLWHYTQHVSVPSAVVRRWQSMLNRFVLSRKHDRDATHVQLIPSEFLYLRRADGGLGVPCLDAQLKRQRLVLSMQFVAQARASSGRWWTTASTELLRSILPRYSGSHALDLLTISPQRHGEMIKWRHVSTWWKTTWTWWHRTRWEKTWRDLPSDDRVEYALHQPIWFHSDADLHYEQRMRGGTTAAHRRCIGMVPEPQRSFRLHVSRVFGLRSLADFMRDGSAWPTQVDFVNRHIDFTLVDITPAKQAKWLRTLYREATQIVERLGARAVVLQATDGGSPRLVPYVGVTSNEKLCLFPEIPRSAVMCIVWTPKSPTKPHPMKIHWDRVDEDTIKAHVKLGKRLRKVLLPIFDDLQFRLAFRLLPVRSRFWFLEAANPGIRKCVRDGCDAIESEQHLFFDCTLASGLWRQVLSITTKLFATRPTWLDIALARQLRVCDEWMDHETIIADVWHVLRAVTLHFVWSDRNRCLFDGRQPTPTTPALLVIFTTASAHFRYNLRCRYDDDERASLEKALTKMRKYPPFGDFATTHPAMFQVRHLQH
ncbi:putative Pollike protein, partial [Globisporangium splendens]